VNDESRPKDFLREIIDEHNRRGTYGGRVGTRFPPEPNGYLHIGHAKSICLNFGLAKQYGGTCNLRMDDTNPTTENPEYVASIQEDVRWLGFEWTGFYNASDYFQALYDFAERLIHDGKAYVCSLSEADMRTYRGSISEAGKPSPYRDRSVEENLDLFRRMRKGEFADGTHTLRAKIDMANPNMKLRDPPIYRIRRAHHYRTGDAWPIYPLYDFAHCLSDALEKITHSICTLEFENNRELYDWILDQLVPEPRPHQYEFARLVITYTVLSKRKLLELVTSGFVDGWDDPRMPTISGLRRRGYRPEAMRAFAETIGVSKNNSVVEVGLLESIVRDDLNRSTPRVLAVLDPLEVTLTNIGDDEVEWIDAPYFPPDIPEGTGSRKIPLGKHIYIDREDFAEVPPKGFRRLSPGGEVRLRYGGVIRCDEVVKDANGHVTSLRCTLDSSPDKKTKGTIQWVSRAHAVDAEVRLYDRLFSVENPDRGDVDYKTFLNPTSLIVKKGCKLEPSLGTANPGDRFQFERVGFFMADPKASKPGALVWNRTVALKDSWAKQVEAPEPAEAPKQKREEAGKGVTKELSPEAEALREQHGIGAEEARVIAADAALGALFDAAVVAGASAKTAAAIVAQEVARLLKANEALRLTDALRFGGAEIAELSAAIDDGTIVAKAARDVLAELAEKGGKPRAIIAEKGLGQVRDEGALTAAVDGVFAAKADVVARYRAGETKLFGVLLGDLMRALGGKVDGKLASEALKKRLASSHEVPKA